MAQEEIVIYEHPNREMKSFLTSMEVSPPLVERFRKPLTEASQPILKKLGLIAGQLVKEIIALPGVVEVEIKPKEIMVKKDSAASWEDLQGRIVTILERSLRRRRIRRVK